MYGYVVIGLLALWNYNKNALDKVKAGILWGTALVAGHIQSHIRPKVFQSTDSQSQRRIRGPQFNIEEDTKKDPQWSYYFLHDEECVRFHIEDLDEFIDREDIELFYARYKNEFGSNFCFVIPRIDFERFMNTGREQIQKETIGVCTGSSESIMEEYKGPQSDFGFCYTGYRVKCEDIYDFDRNCFYYRNMRA